MQTPHVILVADDEPLNRQLLHAWLSPSYTVVEAQDGNQALRVLETSPVDLVLLDVMMPERNGIETCQLLKARHSDSFLPVVLLTALGSQEDRNAGLEAGADEFLTKPIDRRELMLRVRSLLRTRDQEAEIRRHVVELEHLQFLKDDLFSLVVHDLRNPLSAVLGYLELLEGQLSAPTSKHALRHAKQARKAAQQLQDRLGGVLEVRRLEEAQVPLEREAVPLPSLLGEVAALFEGAAAARGIRIEVDAAESAVGSLDPTLVRRAVENLVSNAIKVSARDTTISLFARSDASALLVEVADQGPGVADSEKSALFEKFETGDRTRGFGLGLHLVKLVAHAHGGRSFARDREGGGMVFALVFPHSAA